MRVENGRHAGPTWWGDEVEQHPSEEWSHGSPPVEILINAHSTIFHAQYITANVLCSQYAIFLSTLHDIYPVLWIKKCGLKLYIDLGYRFSGQEDTQSLSLLSWYMIIIQNDQLYTYQDNILSY